MRMSGMLHQVIDDHHRVLSSPVRLAKETFTIICDESIMLKTPVFGYGRNGIGKWGIAARSGRGYYQQWKGINVPAAENVWRILIYLPSSHRLFRPFTIRTYQLCIPVKIIIGVERTNPSRASELLYNMESPTIPKTACYQTRIVSMMAQQHFRGQLILFAGLSRNSVIARLPSQIPSK
jgi:hypothetical protein